VGYFEEISRMKKTLLIIGFLVLLIGCAPERDPIPTDPDANDLIESHSTNGGLNVLRSIGCIAIAVAVGIAIANMGNGLKAILIGVICGAGTLTGLAVMLQYYAKWVGLIMMIGFALVAIMIFISLFINKGFLTLPFIKKNGGSK
jgi:hypothetical protein